ncbi:MAG: hypothetical protein WD939_02695 [Dehalococcoidia bacterium]
MLALSPACDTEDRQAQLVAETPTSDPSVPTPTARPIGGGNQGARLDRGIVAVVAEGQGSLGFFDRVVVVTGPAYGHHTIIWMEDYEGRSQVLASPTDVVRGTLSAPDSVVMQAVLNEKPGSPRELGIVYDATAFGSGSPTARFALLRLEEDAWRVVWDSGADEDWRGSHGRVEFPSGDTSELVVRSDSWVDGYDELSDVLHESNSGPHRYFVDTWQRDGDDYVRVSAQALPAPYATLVEFLHALSVGDESGALERVTDDELVSVARGVGMDAAPGNYWTAICEDGLACGEAEPITFDPTRYHGEPPVAVYFEERDGQWLISDIRRDDGS